MNVQYMVGILTVLGIVAIIWIICDAVDSMKKKQKLSHNIYRDIQPHQVAMMKKIFPNFDWVRIDREIAMAQAGSEVVYEPTCITPDGVVHCNPKKIDTRV